MQGTGAVDRVKDARKMLEFPMDGAEWVEVGGTVPYGNSIMSDKTVYLNNDRIMDAKDGDVLVQGSVKLTDTAVFESNLPRNLKLELFVDDRTVMENVE